MSDDDEPGLERLEDVINPNSGYVSDPRGIQDFTERARNLYQEIKSRLGESEARGIFRLCSEPPGETPQRERKKDEVLSLYYNPVGGNKDALAAELAEKNKSLPKEQRYGTGSTRAGTMRKYIHRTVQEFERTSPDLALLLSQLFKLKP